MKKTYKTLLYMITLLVFLFCGMSNASAAVKSTTCSGEAINVSTFTQLKNALENFTSGQNIVFSGNISATNDNTDYTINIKNNGSVAIDFNGYILTVSSKSTKYLFNITGKSKVFFVNGSANIDGSVNKGSAVYFNTTKSGAALVMADYSGCEVANINVNFYMGNTSGYTKTTDGSETAVFRVNKAAQMNIFGGAVINKMTNGNGIVVEETSENKSSLEFRVGGNAKIQAEKYCVSFNPTYVKIKNFSSVKLVGNGSYERIKLPSDSTLTVKTLWSTAADGTSTTIYIGGSVWNNHNKKIVDLNKSDITANKTCDTLSNEGYFTVLYCSAGHFELCGSCHMSYRTLKTHSFKNTSGEPADCYNTGLTSGKFCTVCDYSTQKTIAKKEHSLTYYKETPVSCGVDGMKAHYYCSICSTYFTDSEAKNKVEKSELTVKHNHKYTTLAYKSPTCKEEGKTQGTYCETCKKVIQAQQTISKTSHSYPTYWTVVRSATCSETGLRKKVCTNCGNEITETIDKISHNYDANGNCTECSKNENSPEPDPTPNPENPDSDKNTVNCSCSCHKKGFKNFLFKIILFFQRILRINQYCKGCGVAHY